ncbi:MAG: DUF3047 domain-containing protein, partial [Candidatus Binatia bacterium]
RIAARRWDQVRRRRRASPSPTPLAAAAAERQALRNWFAGLPATPTLRDTRLLELEASQIPWLDTGIDLEEGEWITTIAAGRVVISDALDVWVGPQFQLWARVGEETRIFNGTGDTNSFRAANAGRLYLANYFPGQWGDPNGRVSTSLAEYAKFGGGITAAVLRWTDSASDGLEPLLRSDHGGAGWIADEQQRLREDVQPPAGWNYLWFLGRSRIFQAGEEEGRACIRCHTHRDVGILQHEAPFEMSAGTKLRWSWKVDELPSLLPENSAVSHDYLSVAVEFENGRDITYTWSPEIAVGTGYWCPLATWKDREFHVVVRSGTAGLGTWLDEERDLHADYVHYMGEPPRRVVRVWLIAVSLFQRQTGRASFSGFSLESADGAKRLAIG